MITIIDAHLSRAITCELILGAQNVRLFEESQVVVDVYQRDNEIVVHPLWDPSNVAAGNDLAVLNLPNELTFSQYIQPIALPARSDADKDWAGFVGTASGWGLTADSEPAISDELNWMETEIKSNSACNTWWLGTIKSTQICGSGAGGRSICSGDSGGPIYVEEGSSRKQVGISSFVISLGCEIGYPFVFTRTSSFLDFIEASSSWRADP